MFDWIKKIRNYAGLDDEDEQNYLNSALQQANSYLNGVDTSRKSASKLYQEGREAAGTAAADKAGIAKKEAKASAMMNGAGKLQSAIQGAQAATDAVQNGYDETASNAAALGASQENAEKNAELTRAQNLANAALQTGQSKANSKANTKKNRIGVLGTASQFLGSSSK